MLYEKTLKLDPKKYAYYETLMNSHFDEDITYSETVTFPNEMQMDIKICGADDDDPWTEAVLFDKNGSQLCFTDPSDEFFGEWELEYNNDTYIVNIVCNS